MINYLSKKLNDARNYTIRRAYSSLMLDIDDNPKRKGDEPIISIVTEDNFLEIIDEEISMHKVLASQISKIKMLLSSLEIEHLYRIKGRLIKITTMIGTVDCNEFLYIMLSPKVNPSKLDVLNAMEESYREAGDQKLLNYRYITSRKIVPTNIRIFNQATIAELVALFAGTRVKIGRNRKEVNSYWFYLVLALLVLTLWLALSI